VSPLNLNPSLTCTLEQIKDVRTVGSVYAHATTLGNKAYDLIAWDWIATARDSNEDILHPLDVHHRALRHPARALMRHRGRIPLSLKLVALHSLGYRTSRDVSLAHRNQQSLTIV
jgi:hypothetical protein